MDDRQRRLTVALSRSLPGLAAQQNMAPFGRIRDDYDPTPPAAQESAVLLLLTPNDEIVFIRRSQDGRTHGGQIALPGGTREPYDATLDNTATRETNEEIGVAPSDVTTLGLLTRLYIPVSNFSVQPVLGLLRELPKFVCQPGEVDEVLLFRIADFAGAIHTFEYEQNGSNRPPPCYRFGDVVIWGATAMIVAEFLAVWRQADL
jgi:8-oxo-dGTP pyrophosphatase MutT (NUDIX family)